MTGLVNGVKKIVAVFIAFINMIGIMFFSWPEEPAGAKLNLDKFTLVWEDEFEGNSIDWSSWRDHGGSQGNATIRRGGWWHRDMAEVKDGCLYINTAYKENGIANGEPGYYTYGMDTNGLVMHKYGYFEVRCIVPEGEGTWAAFWMLSDGMGQVTGNGHSGAEVDVFESPYYTQKLPHNNAVSSAVHIDGYGDDHKGYTVGKFVVNNPYTQFNTYGLEWNENEYIFYINGVETKRGEYGGTAHVAQYMLLSVEFGGENAIPENGWAGDIRNNKHLPSSFIVDYVRVYQYNNLL